MTAPTLAPRRYLRLVAILGGLALALAALGYVPTVRLAGPDGTTGMIAGIVASLLANALGGLPLMVPRDSAAAQAQSLLQATALRFGAVLVLGLVVALSGAVPLAPALLWLALSYLVLVAAEAALTAGAAARKGV